MTLPALISGGGRFTAMVGEDWLQGRTCYGGVSAALTLMAAKAAHGDLPQLRSVQIAFIGPVAGKVDIVPSLLRRGKNSAFVGCDLSTREGIGLRALLLFMSPRESHIEYVNLPMPVQTPFEGAVTDGATTNIGFLKNFEFMAVPEQKADQWMRWVRLKSHHGLDAEVELLAIADALPPAAMRLARQWGPISSATWQLNLTTDRPQTKDGWWLMEATTLSSSKGASSQSMTIWNAEGTPIATATQSVALFV